MKKAVDEDIIRQNYAQGSLARRTITTTTYTLQTIALSWRDFKTHASGTLKFWKRGQQATCLDKSCVSKSHRFVGRRILISIFDFVIFRISKEKSIRARRREEQSTSTWAIRI